MPRGLPKRARQFWKAHADQLDRLGILTEADGAAFTVMAIHYAVAWEAMEQVLEDGLLQVDENGAARKHPLLQVWRENSAAYLRYAVQFGLTPSARGRLSILEAPQKDEYEEFLSG